jgi:hypothetical protein
VALFQYAILHHGISYAYSLHGFTPQKWIVKIPFKCSNRLRNDVFNFMVSIIKNYLHHNATKTGDFIHYQPSKLPENSPKTADLANP